MILTKVNRVIEIELVYNGESFELYTTGCDFAVINSYNSAVQLFRTLGISYLGDLTVDSVLYSLQNGDLENYKFTLKQVDFNKIKKNS